MGEGIIRHHKSCAVSVAKNRIQISLLGISFQKVSLSPLEIISIAESFQTFQKLLIMFLVFELLLVNFVRFFSVNFSVDEFIYVYLFQILPDNFPAWNLER